MISADWAGESKTPPPPSQPPSRPPVEKPRHPPTKPPNKGADEEIFAAVDEIRRDLARPHKPRPPSKPPKKPINTKPIRGFRLPVTRVPLVFGEGRDRLVGRVGTAPVPHPTGPMDPPIPHPPPPLNP